MFECAATIILLWTTAFAAFAPDNRVLITTLNRYWFTDHFLVTVTLSSSAKE